MKTKQPKRIKGWVNEFAQGVSCWAYVSRKEAKDHVGAGALRVAVPLIEIRRGELVVDVEALAEAVALDLVAVGYDEEDAPTFFESARRALKRVGVR